MKKIDRIITESINEFIQNDVMDEKSVLQDPKFQEWFSHGGLTDENGKPLLVYHGSGKDFDNFDIETTYEGYLCFSPDKKTALYYTEWDNGDDDWRTIKDADDYLQNEGWYGNDWDLLNRVNDKMEFENDEERKKYIYNIILRFYKEQYSHPTLYYCYLRNAEINDLYKDEYNVYDDDDVWIVKKEQITYKPFPEYPSNELNTYSL